MKRIFEVAKLLFPVFLEINKEELEERKGAVLAISEIDNNKPGNYLILGELPSEKLTEKKNFAFEKINRLREQNKDENEELSSFVSENIEEQKFGGGIKTKNCYIALSGFPPHLDQKFVMDLCLMLDELSYTTAVQIMEDSFTQRKAWEREAK